MLSNTGLLLRANASGFSLYGTRDESFQENTEDVPLRFFLVLKDPFFYQYTETHLINLRDQIFYFTNKGDRPLLHNEKYVSARDIVPAKSIEFPGLKQPFALIEIAPGQHNTQAYKIQFRAASTRLRYILVSRHLQTLNGTRIINPETGETFSGPENRVLPDGKQALVFESVLPMPLAEKMNTGFQLQSVSSTEETQRVKTIIKNLPSPDITIISSSFPTSNKQFNFSEIFI